MASVRRPMTLSELQHYCRVSSDAIRDQMDNIYNRTTEAMLAGKFEEDFVLKGVSRDDERIIVNWLDRVHGIQKVSRKPLDEDGTLGLYLSWYPTHPSRYGKN